MTGIGTNLLLGNNAQFVRRPFADFVSAAWAHKVQGAELTLQSPHFYVDSAKYHSVDEQKKLLSAAGIEVVSLQPLPYRYSICADANTLQHEKTVDYYRRCILLAKELGASYLCVTASGANYDQEPKRLLGNAEAAIAELAEFAGDAGVMLLLGSVFGEESPINASTPVLTTLKEIHAVLTDLGSKNLGVYLDTAVISVCGEKITQWFQQLGENIRLVRFTDGNYNGYRAWNDGCLPCTQYLNQIRDMGYHGPLALTIPGERYVENPEEAFSKNIEAVRRRMEE